ncbi:sugar phosphate isomerase/epimerase family protein [Streptomyces sp. SP18CS02]|uniref:sugar phosphate isomerase/epimerase family protein n=1 Tax=Streptomyces sp. SP18CS02 TaxID=3002531 RepID=UPI002E76DD27|nr:sugar phosphate isomerase/epimerase family protein [Streptomyces sp. SP18CS02]MEE1756451.1 sugar phosphate isomerase/epimerase [Streptomyces sp. SP18CS02]
MSGGAPSAGAPGTGARGPDRRGAGARGPDTRDGELDALTPGGPARRAGAPRVGLAGWRLPVEHARAVELTRRSGADGLQLDLGGPGRGARLDDPATLDEVRSAAAAHGVELLAVSGNTLNDIGLTAPEGTDDARRARRTLIRVLDAAHALGAPLAFVPSFRRSAIDGPRALRRTVSVLSWAAGEAADRGLSLANENDLAPDRARALAEEIGSPAFRLLLDTYNPRVAGVDVLALVEATAGLLAPQVHLKDGVDGVAGQVPLGDGDGRVAEALAALRKRDFAPYALVLENDYRDGGTERLARDIDRARSHARDFRTSMEKEIHA